MSGGWDLTALINAADAKAGLAERHLWMVRLMEWLRHEPNDSQRIGTPLAVLRVRQLLHVMDHEAELRVQVQQIFRAFWAEIDSAALLADFGFGSRLSLRSELATRLRQRVLPGTPETQDLAALFLLLFEPADRAWVAKLDDATLARLAALCAPEGDGWRDTVLNAMTMLASAVRADGFAPQLRQRMDPELLRDEPFRQLAGVTEDFRRGVLEAPPGDSERDILIRANMLHAMLDRCMQAAASVAQHLQTYGVSVDIVYELDQMQARARRIELLMAMVLAREPAAEVRTLLAELLDVLQERRGFRALLARHYSMLARQVAERSAETGEHYITRDGDEYRDMLRRAAGGGAVIAGTTFLKFAIAAIGLSAFWGGFWAGANYATSFLIVMLMHWTVATKQPAMTAPAMAASLPAVVDTRASPANAEARDDDDAQAIEAFVDRVTHLIRSQVAGIIGNLMLCGPLVLTVQVLATWLLGKPLIGVDDAAYVLDALTLLGPTALFAAFTGVLLFASSLIAGWAENWFVFQRLDSAIAWNPRIVARLGAARAARWAAWWRANISGVAASVSLGMMLGLAPALLGFLGVPLEARHVTLSTGQLSAAVGALGWPIFSQGAFWWCVAGIAVTGALNLSVSFWLAFKVALRSRGVQLKQRERIYAAIWRRLRRAPLAFLWPQRER